MKTIVDQSALDPLPDDSGRCGPILRDTLEDALSIERLLEQAMPDSVAHISMKLRRRTLSNLNIWINEIGHKERETVRLILEKRRNADRLALWEAIGGPERVLDRQRQEEAAA